MEGSEAGSQGAAALGDRGPRSRGRPRRRARCLQEVTGLSRAAPPQRGVGRRRPGSRAWTPRAGRPGGRSPAGRGPRAQVRRGAAPGRAAWRGPGAAAVPGVRGPCPSRGAPRPQPHGAYGSVGVFISFNSLEMSPALGGPGDRSPVSSATLALGSPGEVWGPSTAAFTVGGAERGRAVTRSWGRDPGQQGGETLAPAGPAARPALCRAQVGSGQSGKEGSELLCLESRIRTDSPSVFCDGSETFRSREGVLKCHFPMAFAKQELYTQLDFRFGFCLFQFFFFFLLCCCFL